MRLEVRPVKLSSSTIGSRWSRPCPHCEGDFVRGQRFVACCDCETAHHVRCATEAQACKADQCAPVSEDPRVPSGRLREIRQAIRKDETKRLKRRELFAGSLAGVKRRLTQMNPGDLSAAAQAIVLGLCLAGAVLMCLAELGVDGHFGLGDRKVGLWLMAVGFTFLAVQFTRLQGAQPG
jgi:hypothetical protein